MTDTLPQLPGSMEEPRCRFDMFVRMKPQFIPRNGVPTWCHRGDKFSDIPEKMIQSLIRMFIRHNHKYVRCELYDNTKPRNDDSRVILKFENGVIETNKLAEYDSMLQIPLPDFLKQ